MIEWSCPSTARARAIAPTIAYSALVCAAALPANPTATNATQQPFVNFTLHLAETAWAKSWQVHGKAASAGTLFDFLVFGCPMKLRPLLLASAALLAPHHAFAQDAAAPAAEPIAAPAAQPGDADMLGEEEEETIVVTGARPRGSVVGDIPAENVLSTRDIRATGATTISELLDAVAAQTGSARGRDGGRPILLLNGQRISGFRELRDLPPEAIERMEILPEEVALKYGYSADQRVVNIVLRRRFNSTSAEAGATVATDGGYLAGKATPPG